MFSICFRKHCKKTGREIFHLFQLKKCKFSLLALSLYHSSCSVFLDHTAEVTAFSICFLKFSKYNYEFMIDLSYIHLHSLPSTGILQTHKVVSSHSYPSLQFKYMIFYIFICKYNYIRQITTLTGSPVS